MKRLLFFFILILTAFAFACSQDNSPDNVKRSDLNEERARLSYALGLDIGKRFKYDSVDLDTTIFTKGFTDGMTSDTHLLNEQELMVVLSHFKKQTIEKQMKKTKEVAEGNKRAGADFLENNKKEDGVVILESGLQYKIIEEGSGEKPKETDTVIVHYSGKLINGQEFDSSYATGKPATIPVNGLISGWSEALQRMNKGAKWKIFIPSHLGYGDIGAGNVPPGSTIIFDIELIDIQKS